MLPVWQRAVQPHIDSGALVVIGVVQDQHADRVALYKQWRKLGWPIFVDAWAWYFPCQWACRCPFMKTWRMHRAAPGCTTEHHWMFWSKNALNKRCCGTKLRIG